jgi:hypothetical protein
MRCCHWSQKPRSQPEQLVDDAILRMVQFVDASSWWITSWAVESRGQPGSLPHRRCKSRSWPSPIVSRWYDPPPGGAHILGLFFDIPNRGSPARLHRQNFEDNAVLCDIYCMNPVANPPLKVFQRPRIGIYVQSMPSFTARKEFIQPASNPRSKAFIPISAILMGHAATNA